MVKYISILGSTGSIGTSALDVVTSHPEHFKIIGLTANHNIDLLEKWIYTFYPRIVSVSTKELADALRKRIPTDTKVTYGTDGLIEVATHPDSTLEAHHSIVKPDLETVLDADHWAREYANELLIRKWKKS